MFQNLNSKTIKRGFTLIELLVVIAILAVLATAVVLILNPAEMVKRSRDATRLADLATVQSAIALYWAEYSSPAWNGTGPNCTAGTSKPGAGSGTCALNATTTVDSNGWVPLNFNNISGGSPLGKLPIDPLNGETGSGCAGTPQICCYAFKASSTTGIHFKLGSNLESTKYAAVGTSSLESNDGGTVDTWYEVGNVNIAW